MILDISTQLATAFAPTLVAATPAPNYLDLLALADAGMGADWIWYTNVKTLFTSAGAATLDLILQGNATDPTFAAGNVTVLDSGVIALAALVKGYELKLKYPRGFNVRYLRVVATIGTAAMTAGAIDSWLTNDDMQDVRAYPAGYSVA
jgi:hypothetical protein